MIQTNSNPLILTPRVVTRGIATPVAILAGPPITYTPQNTGVKLWVGEGPPPVALPAGFVVDDQWLDQLTGVIYRLDPGE